jgi:cellulose synthase/poly-beta-1,6-N-acetylglucosamine synthase-like glycosyltransferase
MTPNGHGPGGHVLDLALPISPRPLTSVEPRSATGVGSDLVEILEGGVRERRTDRKFGVLAAFRIAEHDGLVERLGAHAADRVTAEVVALLWASAECEERHVVDADGVIWLVVPNVTSVAGQRRLRELSHSVVDAVFDIGGEMVRVTPVIGYATFDQASSAHDLRELVLSAVEDARLHLDLVPIRYEPRMRSPMPEAGGRDRLLELADRLRSPIQLAFTMSVLLSFPFIVYVAVWYLGFDLTTVVYPAMAVAITAMAVTMWVETGLAKSAPSPPERPGSPEPRASIIVAAYLPNEAGTIIDTLSAMLTQQYAGGFQVVLAYNSPRRLPVEVSLERLAAEDPRLVLLRVDHSTSKAQNVNAALAVIDGEFVGVFDADHHPAPGSFSRAWQWLSNGYDIVQGHCVVRNGDASWVARLIAVEFETIYAVSHPGRAKFHDFGIFGGSNGYWRVERLRKIRMHRSMLTEDIDSSIRSLLAGARIASDPGLISTELAPTTIRGLWHQRMRWAQGWSQTARRHVGPVLRSDTLTLRQRAGATFLLGWAQIVPWITIQVVPIAGFLFWRHRGIHGVAVLVPALIILTIFNFTVGPGQTAFAYVLGDQSIRRHRRWFFSFGVHSLIWFAEFKNIIARIAQLKELIGEHEWRVTPRTGTRVGDDGTMLGGTNPSISTNEPWNEP